VPADTTTQPLVPQLEAIAAAAERQLRALASEEPTNTSDLGQALAEAATAPIASGHPIAAVADAEQRGQHRARSALSRELLNRVERAAQVAHGTIRATLARASGNIAPAPPDLEKTSPASDRTDTLSPS
jgi:hypothetical protein